MDAPTPAMVHELAQLLTAVAVLIYAIRMKGR
jgi:hypothetical protein